MWKIRNNQIIFYMKKLLLLLALLLSCTVGEAYAQEKTMQIRKTNGKRVNIKTTDVDSIVFLGTTMPAKSYWQDTVYITEYVSSGVPDGVTKHDYTGERINLFEDNSYGFEKIASNSQKGQSGAVYGDYLFIVADKLAKVCMYNLRTQKSICICTLTPHTETVSSTSTSVLYHCNQSTFGTVKYDESDPFPLLYVSQRAPKSTGKCFVNVLRLVPKLNSAGTEYTSLTVEEVQTIYLPEATTANALGNANFTIDPQTGYFYTYSRNNSSSASNYLNCRITKFTPKTDLSKKEIYMSAGDILESYEIFDAAGKNISAENMQGGFICNSKLYIAQGYASCKFINIRVVDLSQKKMVSDVDLLSDGFTEEPEAFFMYGGYIMTSTNSANIYRFYFN